MSLDLIEFATDFVILARKEAKKSGHAKTSDFSSRQSAAIAAMGLARTIRRRKPLGEKDLVELAVVTSFPKIQGFARSIALRVIYGDEVVEFPDSQQGPATSDRSSQHMTGKSLMLELVREYIEFQKSRATTDREVAKFANRVEDELFGMSGEEPSPNGSTGTSAVNCNQTASDDQETNLERARRRIAYDLVGGREGIIRHGIRSWKELFDRAVAELLQSIPEIRHEELHSAQILDVSLEIAELSEEGQVQLSANLLYVSGHENSEELLNEFAEIEESCTLAQVVDLYDLTTSYRMVLNRFAIRESFYAQNLKDIIEFLTAMIRESSKTLSDILHSLSAFDHNFFTESKVEELIEESLRQESAVDILHEIVALDSHFETNFEERTSEILREELKDYGLEDLLQRPSPSSIWEDVVQDKLGELDFQDEFAALEELKKAGKSSSQDLIEELIDSVMSELVQKSSSFDQLNEIVGEYRSQHKSLPHTEIMQRARELELTKKEIGVLLDDVVEYIKALATERPLAYDEVKFIANNRNLTRDRLYELAEFGKHRRQTGILGYVAEQDIHVVTDTVGQSQQEQELLYEAFGAGSGENILDQWFLMGNQLREPYKSILKDTAKRIMIDLAKAKASLLIGSSEAGGLPEGTTRPYIIGDDPDAVDIEETIENIVMSGKHFDDVEIEDFVVRRDVNGRRCVVFLIDVSGSMHGRPLAAASLAAAILLTAFNRDELGVALFESSTHVICEVDSDIDLEEVIDEILELQAMGGTMMSRAVEWSKEQLEKSASEDKMFIMLTDAMIGDFEGSRNDLIAISDMGTTSVLVLPEFGYARSSVAELIASVNAHLVEVDDWKGFPDIVTKVLSRG